MTSKTALSPTGIYATKKWVYSGLVQYQAQENPDFAQKVKALGHIYKTYYWSANDPYAFQSTAEIDAYLAETAQEFLMAMQTGKQAEFIQKRQQEQAEAEAEGLRIKEKLEA